MTYEDGDVWTALADRNRRAIVMRLAEGELAVGELAALLPVSHRAEGTKRIYRLNEAGVTALRDQLDMFWKRTMSGFERLMEEDT
jgi:DNA-binding transcriptional ArsR family regulator